MLILAGVIGGIGQLLLTEALRAAPIGVVAPFDYTQLVWAAILGLVLWGELPHPLTLVGAVIVAWAGARARGSGLGGGRGGRGVAVGAGPGVGGGGGGGGEGGDAERDLVPLVVGHRQGRQPRAVHRGEKGADRRLNHRRRVAPHHQYGRSAWLAVYPAHQ